MTSGKRITLRLSAEQKKQIKDATGKNAEGIELTIEELEQRIAPSALMAEGGHATSD